MSTFLDSAGLQTLWNKIKTWVGANFQPKGSYAAESHTHGYVSTVKVGSTSYNVSGNTVSLPAYPSVPSLSGFVNTVNVTGSGNVITDISKSGSTITVTKGNASGGSSGGTVTYVHKSTQITPNEDPILQMEYRDEADSFIELLRNSPGGTYCGGELRLKAFDTDSEATHSLQICPLGIRCDGRQVAQFTSGRTSFFVDGLAVRDSNLGRLYWLNIDRAKELGLLK